MNTIAIDNRPTTLPEATILAIQHAAENDDILQHVECYWDTKDKHLELYAIERKYSIGGEVPVFHSSDYWDYRYRFRNQSVKMIDEFNRDLFNLSNKKIINQIKNDEVNEKLRITNNRSPQYDELNKEYLRLYRERKSIYEDISYVNEKIKQIINWKPRREIIAEAIIQYHQIDKAIERLKIANTQFSHKLIHILTLRKTDMDEINKTRGNPIRKIVLRFVLNPAEYYVQCSWKRSVYNKTEYQTKDWYSHFTAYNMNEPDVPKYVPIDVQEFQKKKLQEKQDKERNAELRKKKSFKHCDFWIVDGYTMERETSITTKEGYIQKMYDYKSFIPDDDLENHNYNGKLIATNTCEIQNDYMIVGYITNDKIIKPLKETEMIKYPPKLSIYKSKRLIPLTGDYDLSDINALDDDVCHCCCSLCQ